MLATPLATGRVWWGGGGAVVSMNGAGAALTAAAAVLRELASVLEALPAQATTPMPSSGSEPLPWPALLWIVPPETRIGRSELLAATGRPKSWLYRHTGKAGRCPRIPHRRVDGELVFVVGELRAWLVQHEVVVVPASPALRVVERARP